MKGVTDAIQARLDAFAQTRFYDDMKSLVGYAGDPDPTFDAEGTYGKNARSATWVTARTIQNDVRAGKRPLPTVAEVLSELPPLVWPA